VFSAPADLPVDVERCHGAELLPREPHALCLDCRRRTELSGSAARMAAPLQSLALGTPSARVVCVARIGPRERMD
jgi:hypothetical protein